VIFTDPKAVKQLVSIFESDWSETHTGKEEAEETSEKNGKSKRSRNDEQSAASKQGND
jgi:hypothetical protein